LDQKHQQLEVDYAIGRDIRPENITEIVSVLADWYELHSLSQAIANSWPWCEVPVFQLKISIANKLWKKLVFCFEKIPLQSCRSL
jgi:hypothetical protein